MGPEDDTPYITMPVHYVSLGSAGGKFPSVCRCAFVTQVNPDDENDVGVCILNPTGFFFNEHVARDEDDRKPGTWHNEASCSS